MDTINDVNRKLEQLSTGDNKFRTLVQCLAAAVYACDAKGRITLFNDAAAALWGRVPEINKETWCGSFRIYRPDGAPLPLAACPMALAVLEGKAASGEELIVECPDGTRRNVIVYPQPIRDASGAIVGALNLVLDVTEHKIAQRALRESEERFRRYFELGLMGMAITSPTRGILEVNDEICRILGYERKELLQMSWDALTHQDDLTAEIRTFDRVMAGEIEGYSIDKRWIGKDGQIIHSTISVQCLRNPNGSVQHFVALCQDVTARKRVEEDRERLQSQLAQAQKMDWLGRLAGGVAHDFKNILGGVVAQAELALAELAAGSRPEEELQRIRSVALHGSEIVQQLMVYAGAESEVVELIEASQIVREMSDLLRVSVSKHAALELDLGEHLPAVRASVTQVRRIVTNLVVNASEAIGDRVGMIRVTIRHVTVGRAAAISSTGLVHDGDYLQLEVSDTGHGMPLDVQVRVFDPFFSTKSASRGLGLAVVHGIVKNLRGEIHVLSEPDKGTTFQILLPCTEAGTGATAGQISSAEEAERPLQEATVLFVEDEDALRQAITKMLRRAGLKVLEAADGSAAVDLLRASGCKIDLILLDLTIPGASSQEVVIEAAQARSDIKVIVTSAYSEERATELIRGPLVKRFIRKPFQFTDLVQAVRTVLAS